MKIFRSFTTTLRLILNAEVSSQELQTGFFSFGCVRDYALNPDDNDRNPVKQLQAPPERQLAIHAQLVTAVQAAEADGRAAWRGDNRFVTLGQINQMLQHKGLAPIAGDEDAPWRGYWRDLEESGQGLEVV